MRTYHQLCLVTTLAAAVFAGAQTTPATTPAKVEITPRAAMSSVYDLSVAGAGLDVSGNALRYQQYITPPDGITLSHLGLQMQGGNGTVTALSLEDLGQNTFAGNLWLLGTPRTLAVEAAERRTTFYRDWAAGAQPLHYRNLTTDSALALGPGALRITAQETRLLGSESWRYAQAGVNYLAPLGSGRIGLGFTHPTYTFDTGGQFNGGDQVLNFTYAPLVTGRTAIEANATVTRTTLDANPAAPRATVVDIHGIHELSPTLTFNGVLTSQQVSNVITRNGYVRRSTGAQLEAEYSGLKRTRIEVGGGQQLVSYVNDPHTLLVKSPVNNLFARVETRLSSTLRLKAGQERFWTTNRPEAFDVLGAPTGSSLLWSQRQDQRVELAYAPGYRWGATAGLRRHTWANTDQGTKTSSTSRDVYAWWMPGDRMTVYAAYLSQGFGLTGLSTNERYTTNGENLVTGLSLQVTPRVALESSYTLIDNTGAEAADQHVLGLGVSYHGPHGTEASLRTAFDTLTGQSDPAQSYDADWTELRLGKSF